jgi:hypothetical protein
MPVRRMIVHLLSFFNGWMIKKEKASSLNIVRPGLKHGFYNYYKQNFKSNPYLGAETAEVANGNDFRKPEQTEQDDQADTGTPG